MAKKKQQLKRRSRKLLVEKVDGRISLWNTNEIIAGRPFMNKLSECIYEHFKVEDFGLRTNGYFRVAMNQAKEKKVAILFMI